MARELMKTAMQPENGDHCEEVKWPRGDRRLNRAAADATPDDCNGNKCWTAEIAP